MIVLPVAAGRVQPSHAATVPRDDQPHEHLDLRQPEAAHHQTQDEHQRDRARPDGQGAEIDRAALRQRAPEADEHVILPVAPAVQAEEIGHLPQRDEKARAGHEADDDRLRNVAREIAQPENGDEDLQDAGHDAEQKKRLHGVPLHIGVERRQRAEDDERDGVGRAVDEVRRRTEDRRHGRDDDGRVEAKTRIDPRDERIGHRLRQRDGGDGEPGQHVAPRGGAGVGERHGSREDAGWPITEEPDRRGAIFLLAMGRRRAIGEWTRRTSPAGGGSCSRVVAEGRRWAKMRFMEVLLRRVKIRRKTGKTRASTTLRKQRLHGHDATDRSSEKRRMQ